MNKRTSMKTKEFMKGCLAYGLLTMTWYSNNLFRCLGSLTYKESKTVLWIMLAVSFLVCGLVLFKYYRTSWHVLVTILLPYGFYTVFTYARSMNLWMKTILGITFILDIVLMILIMIRRNRGHSKKKRTLLRRLRLCLVCSSSVLASGMGIVMLLLLLNEALSLGAFAKSVSVHNEQKQTIDNNIEEVMLLQQDKWETLDIEERLNVLQTIADIERSYLGLPNALNVCAANLNEYTLAAYDDDTYSIYMDIEHLKSDAASDLLDSCCHEAYHSFQNRIVDVYNDTDENLRNLRLYTKAKIYIDELNDYKNGEKDFCLYYSQQLEEDARNYAKEAVVDYYSKIEECMDKEVS